MNNIRKQIADAIKYSGYYRYELSRASGLGLNTVLRISKGEMFTLSDGLLKLLDFIGYELVLVRKDEVRRCEEED